MFSLVCFSSCENFLDVEPPNSKISSEIVFTDDVSATSAIIGIYIDLYMRSSFAGGSDVGVVSLAGLSADELINNPKIDPLYLDFQNNNVSPNNGNVLTLWSSMYKGVFEANSLLEGLSISTGVTAETKNQLRGEALFIRAFCNFYLTNLFGGVPLVTTTDYRVNAVLQRAPVDKIYDQIKKDLLEAESLLPEKYVNNERIRPNKFAVLAFEARIYLYIGDWARAEDKATSVISQTNLYSMSKLDEVFWANSGEAIWQLKTLGETSYTNEAGIFGPLDGPKYNVLNADLLNGFETGDRRRLEWIDSTGSSSEILYLLSKYKMDLSEQLPEEYSMVFRLAEQYLIRAEARAKQNKLLTAIGDVDVIRSRAGLPLIQNANPGINQQALLSAIMQERRIEFMVEWGHRWLDLKRWDIASSILDTIKSGWSNMDVLYPIPQSEILKNSNLKPQNSGY
jgi:hypothetical protein